MKQPKSPFSAYMKILTNHLHIIFLTASFDLQWPSIISQFYNAAEPVANVSQRILSVDCFLDQTGKTLIELANLPRPYVYLLIYLALPLLITAIVLPIWKIIHRRNSKTMWNRSITSLIVLFFLVHPSITLHCFGIFL